MVWRGHRVERSGEEGTYRYRTICGFEAPLAYLSCDDSFDCMECALILDQERLDDVLPD
jgi:hypothetical protein